MNYPEIVRAIAVAVTLVLWAVQGRAASSTGITASVSEEAAVFESRFAECLDRLRTELERSLPRLDPERLRRFEQAHAAEVQARKNIQRAEQELGKISSVSSRVASAQQALAKLDQQITQLSTGPVAGAAAGGQAVESQLARLKSQREDARRALQAATTEWERVKPHEATWRTSLQEARGALDRARAEATQAVRNLGLEFLGRPDLDDKLLPCVVLTEATPRGLAEFCGRNPDAVPLVERLLSDTALMRQMLAADGAKKGRYGDAMRIYTAIQAASPHASTGCLQRLALAIALEHAEPVAQNNPKAATNAPPTVDPVRRYLAYERAYLNGELDPNFSRLDTWDYRMVVDGDEPDEIAAWGRAMLRNYRPDHILTPDLRWRYVGLVKSDIPYGSQNVKYDRPDLQLYQNILMNGGVCGRRAFFGRFLLRSFGIPTTARPQRGHAALVHWTPDGWVVCLGANWGWGWTHTIYGKDVDFLAATQARALGNDFGRVLRARWIGRALGEKPTYGLEGEPPQFWHAVALYLQRAMIEAAGAKALGAVGQEVAEADAVKEDHVNTANTVPEGVRKVRLEKDGTIVIPAVACSRPAQGTGKVRFLKTLEGGYVLHYSRAGNPEPFEYVLDIPQAGRYQLRAAVVTPSWKQHLTLTVNGAGEARDIPLPFTVGMWGVSDPVTIELAKGRNVLQFTRNHENLRGVTIREFTLTPVR